MTLRNPKLWEVGIAAMLIVVKGALSVLLRLDLERRLACAAVRTVVQLLAVGYVLGWVFSQVPGSSCCR
jgi:UDP-glucose/iron transport system permease protein